MELKEPVVPDVDAALLLVQFAQFSEAFLAVPFGNVLVQLSPYGTAGPDSVVLMACMSVPSVKSVQLLVTTEPSTRVYDPVARVKRVLGESVLDESQAM